MKYIYSMITIVKPKHQMKIICSICLLMFISFSCKAQQLPGFAATRNFNEQELEIKDHWKNVIININAPSQFKPSAKTYLVFYALPNGNSIEWTKGKKMKADDDWHFDIQHIAAQTRYVRTVDSKNNYIIVYLMAEQKSWPTWKHSTPDSIQLIKSIVDSVTNIFQDYQPKIILNGHSGGGSFIFGYLDAVKSVPANVQRIAFLDSDYGYEEEQHKNKLVTWLKEDQQRKLLVLAYNDSVVIYNGKPLVSPTGGTWYRSRLMQRGLAAAFPFKNHADTAFITHTALHGRIQFIFKKNPAGLIYHTEQVARNGFILSLLSATKFDDGKHFDYFGERLYQKFIAP